MLSLRTLPGLPLLITALVCSMPNSAMAYIGPGTGLSALGALVALIFGIIVALFGFLWFPIKRLLRKKKASEGQSVTPESQSVAPGSDG